MDALPAAVRVEGRVACSFGLCRRHALEVKRVNGMGDVLLHDSQYLLLPLEGSNAFKRLGNNAHVEMISRAVQVNDFNVGFGLSLIHI